MRPYDWRDDDPLPGGDHPTADRPAGRLPIGMVEAAAGLGDTGAQVLGDVLTARGGWCAPSAPLYDLGDFAVRGGVAYRATEPAAHQAGPYLPWRVRVRRARAEARRRLADAWRVVRHGDVLDTEEEW